MTANRTAVVEALAERLDLDLTAANEIVVCLLAETIADTEARTWKLAAWGLRSDAARYPVGHSSRVTLERAAWAIEEREPGAK